MSGKNVAILVVVIVVVAYLSYLIRKNSERREYFGNLFDIDCEGLYFHGYDILQYFSTAAFERFSQWLDSEKISSALAVLAMMVLKDEPTAVFYQGMFLKEDKELHSWVEFEIPMNGIWVADFSWGGKCFCSKEEYFATLRKDRTEVIFGYRIEQENFWRYLPLANIVYNKMLNPETSNLLSVMTMMFTDFLDDGWLGFSDVACEPEDYFSEEELLHLGEYMTPFECGIDMVSTEIIQDFVKKESRKQPKERSIRRAMSIKKHEEKMAKTNDGDSGYKESTAQTSRDEVPMSGSVLLHEGERGSDYKAVPVPYCNEIT